VIDVKLLEQLDVFVGLNKDQLEKIHKYFEKVEYGKDDKIFTSRQKADYFFILIEGKVHLRFDMPARQTSNEMTITTILPGKSFGWSTMVEEHKYKLSGYSITDKCVLGRAKGEDLRQLFKEDHTIGFIVMSHIAHMASERFESLQSELVGQRASDVIDGW
jgi:CRP-like cAMP-binding protein